jgi:hypothetical protein
MQQETQTTTGELQERQDTPQVLNASAESFNATTLHQLELCEKPSRNESKFSSHWGCGYNFRKEASISGHNVFVLGIDGKPLTPTTNAKARKLMKGNQAKPIWNKFGKFGIEMQVETRKETPNTSFGVDFGTKFEGYAVVVGSENNLSVMWKLPDKKKIVRKMMERKQLRRVRRQRNCRRRPCRINNRNRDGFIAPSQMVMIQSRQKAMREFFKCYPITTVAIEDVCFNHSKHRWGKNFSTIEVGKRFMYDWLREQASLTMYRGQDTSALRKEYGYKKSSKKDAEIFNTHCSDALTIAVDVFVKHHIEPDNFVVVDDTYRCVRRKLHDSQFSKGGVRYKYSTGNAFLTRKGTMCELGQICGATGNKYRINNYSGKRIAKRKEVIGWLSKQFKHHNPQFPYPMNAVVPLRVG